MNIHSQVVHMTGEEKLNATDMQNTTGGTERLRNSSSKKYACTK